MSHMFNSCDLLHQDGPTIESQIWTVNVPCPSPNFIARAMDANVSRSLPFEIVQGPAASARIEKLETLRQRLKEHWRKATETITR